jgi:hypothetical protein
MQDRRLISTHSYNRYSPTVDLCFGLTNGLSAARSIEVRHRHGALANMEFQLKHYRRHTADNIEME